MRPVNASVTAKQANKMLLLDRSRGLLFTANTTSTLSKTVKGQDMLLMMIVMMQVISSSETFVVLHCVNFVKLTLEELAMSIKMLWVNEINLLGQVVGF